MHLITTLSHHRRTFGLTPNPSLAPGTQVGRPVNHDPSNGPGARIQRPPTGRTTPRHRAKTTRRELTWLAWPGMAWHAQVTPGESWVWSRDLAASCLFPVTVAPVPVGWQPAHPLLLSLPSPPYVTSGSQPVSLRRFFACLTGESDVESCERRAAFLTRSHGLGSCSQK